MGSQYEVLRPDIHKHLGLRPQQSLMHFADQVFATALIAEIPALLPAHPLVFAKVSETEWRFFALMGLHPGRNVFIQDDGRWWSDYVPSALRGYPFAAARVNDGSSLVASIDMSSDLIVEDPDVDAGAVRLFDSDGSPSELLLEAQKFLRQVTDSMAQTQIAVDALVASDVIVPWQLAVANPDPQTPFQSGLFRVDLERLNKLPGEKLADLAQKGALLLAYAQVLSSSRVALLANLTHARLAGREFKRNVAAWEDDDAFDFGFNS